VGGAIGLYVIKEALEILREAKAARAHPQKGADRADLQHRVGALLKGRGDRTE